MTIDCPIIIEKGLNYGIEEELFCRRDQTVNVFSPKTVAAYPDEEIRRIGEETPENIVKRKQLRELRGNLLESLQGLKR